MADVIRAAGKGFIQRQRSWLTGLHRKVLSAIVRCRTAALGGHRDRCSGCGHIVAISYNSCRDRHCPRCLSNARRRWLTARQKELLNVPYVHLVFTLPHRLAPLVLHNKKLLYSLLFRASSATLLETTVDPKHLGAEIGFFSVLHTWGQNLMHHPHVHCVIPAGGLSPDHKTWIHPKYRFFLPRGVLSKVFRGKFVHGLKQAYRLGELNLPGELRPLADEEAFHALVRDVHRHRWVVHVKRPFAGPQYVLKYLAHYTHRVAISNQRLISLSEGKVTFRWKDYKDGSKHKLMTLTVDEFLRRFLLHTLPRHFVRIRFFGFMANRRRTAMLSVCKNLLGNEGEETSTPADTTETEEPATWLCPLCRGRMIVIERYTAWQLFLQTLMEKNLADTS
ncbi:MAG: IS91 family transposase [Methanothrix sp.]|nr:IS91 family transposase [Methanothrix sp.]